MHLSNIYYLWWLLPIVAVLVAGYFFSLVDRPKALKIASLTLRGLALACLILALCKPYFSSTASHLHVTFLIDGSASVSLKSLEESILEVEESITELESLDSHSIILFGKSPKEATIDELKQFVSECNEHGGDAQFRSATRLSDAILSARLEFPSDKAKRLVIFSDGIATDAKLTRSLESLKNEGIDLRFNRLNSLDVPEASVTSFQSLSPSAYQGETVRMQASISCSQSMSCNVRLLHRGVEVQSHQAQLSPESSNKIGFDVEMLTAGATNWTLEIQPKEDYFLANNSLSTTIDVSGTPRVLVIHKDPKKMRTFSRAMRKQGIELDVRGARGLPETLEGLLSFKAIILAEVPATDLSVGQMQNLKRYVGDFGGGLAMLGSENSFGIGGYYGTPVDEILPLTSRYEKEKQKPSLAMVLVIDKSGSMSGSPIQLARQAAKSAVELMGSQDSIAVIGFDSESRVIVPMRSASAKGSIQDSIDTMEAGGGTNLYPAMLHAEEMLASSSAKIKHMIILSDGQTQQADYLSMAEAITDMRVTISTVALGDGAAKELMASIADVGKGRYYETNEPSNMPQIFTKETIQASRSAIKEDVYSSFFVGDHPLASGFEKAEMPMVMGYVMTSARPTAQIILAAETGDPLLAVSRYGLGTTLSFTSDLTEKWGSEWLGWAACGKFWSQAIHSILRKENGQGIQLRHSNNQDHWKVKLTRRDDNGQLIDKVQWQANALNQDGLALPVKLQQTGIGTYAADIPVKGSDKLALQIFDTADGRSKTLYWLRPYPSEYQLSRKVAPMLATMPTITASQIRTNLGTETVDSDGQQWFLYGSVLFLFTGILLRRV